MPTRDHNQPRLATTALTRIRASVIGGGVVAALLFLAGCASPAIDSSAEQASVRTVPAESATSDAGNWDIGTDKQSVSQPDPNPQPQPAPTSTPVETARELWSSEPRWSSTPSGQSSPLASSIVDLPAAPIGSVESVEVLRPVGLRIPALGIDEAVVVDVGVEANGDFEVPPASEVGWYRFGPTPGETGSAVLAAHIAQDGVDGVFRYLADLEVGAEFSVIYADGFEREFRVTEMNQYDKDDLPTDDFFRKSGDSQLVLITCGGDFNRQIRSYDDNVVAIAVPI